MDIERLVLLPNPRKITVNRTEFRLTDQVSIWLEGSPSSSLLFSAQKLQREGTARFGFTWKIYEGPARQETNARIVIRSGSEAVEQSQGYRIRIDEDEIALDCQDAAGAYYAVCTLIQLLSRVPVQYPVLQGMEIVDWPDFLVRGVMLDISRDKVYQMQTLLDLVDELSTWKINQLQLYTEHTFAYQKHPTVWQDASPMTAEEIRQLDAYCRERHIELVPNQNSFGHMERWLKHEAYAHLAEVHGEYITPWGEVKTGPYGLAPVEAGSLELLASLYDELLPNFSSDTLNVGCDETFDLGKGKSKAQCDRLGVGKVYLDFLLEIYHLVKQRGKTMQFWGDIILKYPEFLNQIPGDVVGLIWGYEANHPFDQQAARFAAAGLQFYVCPGTSTWNSLAGRTDNTLGNLKNAAIQGLKHGASGYLITDWGDNGHWQTLPTSYLGFAAGAALSWCVSANLELPVQKWLNRHVFEDQREIMGNLAYDLGNADHAEGLPLPGDGGYFWPLQLSLAQIREREKYRPEMFVNGLRRLTEIKQSYMGKADMERPDGELIQHEFALTIRMMEHACRRALFALGKDDGSGLANDLSEIIAEYRRIWLLRNRPGGLKDSLARLQKLQIDYH